MGQMTYGLCYGFPDQKIKGFDCDTTLEEYRAAKADAIKALAKKLNVSTWQAQHQILPDWNGEGTYFCGFFIAAGGSGKEGLPYLEGFRLADLDTDKRYKKAMKTAADAWAKFADWCSQRGIDLPAPQLWLIECEVA